MAQVTIINGDANARGPTSGFNDVSDDYVKLPTDFNRETAKLFTPLKVGAFQLQHRIVHAALGRSRSAFGTESPLAAEYFAQRTTPGSLVISQATSTSLEAIPWHWSACLHTDAQINALSRTIEAVHKNGGIWFQQLFHVGRCTSPALVKRAWENAGHTVPNPQGYQSVSSSDVAETGMNTHSGEPFGKPRPLSLDEISGLRRDFKMTARNAVKAGADGIEILSGNGFLLDQFLHDNINLRTDKYGGSIENRARLIIEIVDDIAEVVGYQKIGIRISPFSNFHETDGSQPLDQTLYLCRVLALRGIAYLNVGEPRVSRNLDFEENVNRLLKKGIAPEDLSLRQFRKLTQEVKPSDSSFEPTRLFGNGGYTSATSLLTVEEGLADGVVFGRRYISNPDLVRRVQIGFPFTPYDRSTFYTHGAQGYVTYKSYEEEEKRKTETNTNGVHDVVNTSFEANANGVYTNGVSHKLKRVAILGAGVSGIVSANSFQRLGGFELRIFERKAVPGGSWAFDPVSSTVPLFPGTTPEEVNPPLSRPEGQLPVTIPRLKQQRFTSTPQYLNLHANIPHNVMFEGTAFKLPAPQPETAPYLRGPEICESVAHTAHKFDQLISYNTTVEDVIKLEDGRLRLLLRRENEDCTDYWYEEDFDFLVVANGHNSVPRVPSISGLDLWKGGLRHTVTYRSGEEFKNQRILIVGTSESAIDVCLQSLPSAKQPVFVSQRTPHPRYPTVFNRPGVTVVPTISRFGEKEVYLSDGRTLTDIDTVIFATGYFYNHSFLSKVRPPTNGQRIPGLYQHVFDIYNPNIAFIGAANASLSWLTWEKSAFLAALLFSGRIHLPLLEEQKNWETKRLAEVNHNDRMFHILSKPHERVLYFEDLNELAWEYLHTHATDDVLLRSFPYEWLVELANAGPLKAKFYGIEPRSMYPALVASSPATAPPLIAPPATTSTAVVA